MTLVGALVYSRDADADSDTLLPMTFESFASDFRRALAKAPLNLNDPLTVFGCLEGNAAKRKVCTYKLGGYMSVMIASTKGGTDVVG